MDKEKTKLRNAQRREYRKNYKKMVYQKCREYCSNYKKKHPCEKCGESHIACLSFHHKDRKEKRDEVTILCKYSLNIVMKEIEKCKILCHNCHAKFHWEERLKGYAVT